MRTQWQSSHIDGNTIFILLKGNHITGNGIVRMRENLLDLRRKVYYMISHYEINLRFLPLFSLSKFKKDDIKIVGDYVG